MATDFSKLMYHAVEAHVKGQMDPEQLKKMDKHQWRNLMDVVMLHFANSLVSIVSSVAKNQAEAKAKAEAEAQAQAQAAQSQTVPQESAQ